MWGGGIVFQGAYQKAQNFYESILKLNWKKPRLEDMNLQTRRKANRNAFKYNQHYLPQIHTRHGYKYRTVLTHGNGIQTEMVLWTMV